MIPIKSHLTSRCRCCGVRRTVDFLSGELHGRDRVVEVLVALAGFRLRRRFPEGGGPAHLRMEVDHRWLIFEDEHASDVDLATVGVGRLRAFSPTVVLEPGKYLRVTVEDPYVAPGLEVEFVGEVLT